MDKLRVDQSHCNYYLARWIEFQGGTVLFTDAGRVTRGGAGSQGKLLNIFESNRLPIPDIVAILDNNLVIVEIDNNIKKASKSLTKFASLKPLLKKEIFLSLDSHFFDNILVAFCFTGLKSKGFIQNLTKSLEIPYDVLFIFAEPRLPNLVSF